MFIFCLLFLFQIHSRITVVSLLVHSTTLNELNQLLLLPVTE